MAVYPNVSIIMPVYNTGVILHNTIKSIINQTYTDFELLLINDGSKDNSGIICDEYAQSDNRIFVIHKDNGGISEARNFGIEKAKGNYIAFCDHDDIYNNKLLEITMHAAKLHNADVVKYGVNYEIETGSTIIKQIRTNKNAVLENLNLKQKLVDYINLDLFTCIWDGLYKKSLLVEHKITFDAKYKKGHEDVNFNNQIIPYINKLVIINEILYTHYVRKSLSTSAKFYDEILNRFIEYPTEVEKIMLNMKIEHKLMEVGYYYFFSRKILISTLSYMIQMKKSKKCFTEKLNELHSKNATVSSCNINFFTFCKYAPEKKYFISYFFMIFFKKNKYELLYYLSKILFIKKKNYK